MPLAELTKTRESGRKQPYRALKLLWLNLSILIVGAIFLELFAFTCYLVRNSLWGPPDPAVEFIKKLPVDAYADRSWLVTVARQTPELTVRWNPYTYWRRKPFSGTYVTVDRNGIRRTWNTPNTNPINIYMFGGSTLFGVGARDDYTIPSYLSKMLAQVFAERVHVTNYGQNGYVNTQEMVDLFRELQAGNRPDVVIFYDGYNDAFSALQQHVAGLPQNEFNRSAEFNILNPGRAHDFYLEVLKRSNVYKLMRGLRNRVVEEKPVPPLSPEQETQLVSDVMRIYLTNTTMIESIGKTMGFTAMFYWQPSVYSRSKATLYEQSWTQESEHRFFTETYAAAKHSSLAAKPSFHDISDVFDGYEGTLYVDYAHTTERGNEIVARRIYQDVAPLLKERIGP
jgi:lysophospholipase L1-like esterase